MELLSQDNFDESIKDLKMAERLCRQMWRYDAGRSNEMIALTNNNLGCYYKKAGKPNVAL